MNMFVGTAALASASMLPDTGKTASSETAPSDMPLLLETARPELRDAIKAFRSTYDDLMKDDDAKMKALDCVRAWELKNPAPGAHRAFKKWTRRYENYLDEVGCTLALDNWTKSRAAYREAQMALARVRALNFDEIALKSVASLAFEGGYGDKPPQRRHLRTERQIVAFSVAWDAVMLSRDVSRHGRLAAPSPLKNLPRRLRFCRRGWRQPAGTAESTNLNRRYYGVTSYSI